MAMLRGWGLVAMVVLSYAPYVEAKEVHVLRFSFQIPDQWYVEGDGKQILFANGSRDPYSFPFIIAESCPVSTKRPCAMGVEFPPRDVKGGCAKTQADSISRNDRISEKRWICDTVPLEKEAVSGGFALFEIDGAILTIACGSTDRSTAALLDTISKTLTFTGQ